MGNDYLTNCIGVFFIYFLALNFYFFEELLAELFDDASLSEDELSLLSESLELPSDDEDYLICMS